MVDPLQPLEIVLIDRDCRDDALAEDMDFEAYAKTRDPELIREKPGLKARRFTVGKIGRAYLAEVVDGAERPSSRFALAFQAACHAYRDEAGALHKAEARPGAYNQPVAPVEWLNEVADAAGMPAVYELGRVAWLRARLPAGKSGPLF